MEIIMVPYDCHAVRPPTSVLLLSVITSLLEKVPQADCFKFDRWLRLFCYLSYALNYFLDSIQAFNRRRKRFRIV